MGLKRLTYALENGSSTIAALLCQSCNVGMLLYCHCNYHCFFPRYCNCHCHLIPVSVVTPVAANAAFLLATLIASHTSPDVTIVGILPNNLLLCLLL